MRYSNLIIGVLLAVVLATSAQAQFWCWDADEILAEVGGAAVHIQHLAALYNCCPDPITYDVEVGDATILVVEHTLSPCDCECCYNLELTVESMPPGPWNLLFQWFDTESWEWTERLLEITIPDVGQALEPVIGETFHTDCLFTTNVSDLAEFPLSWGTVKAHYR